MYSPKKSIVSKDEERRVLKDKKKL
jgi:tetrahydromethanopterin S-methyltransferase subunit G